MPTREQQLVNEIYDRTLELKKLIEEPTPDPGPQPIITRVRPGDKVDLAFDELQKTGGTLLCEPGEYSTRLIIRERPLGAPPVFVKGASSNLPPDGKRITKEYQEALPIFLPRDADDTVVTEPAANGVTFAGVGFGPNATNIGATLVALGNEKRYMKTMEEAPSNIAFDKVLFFGQNMRGQHVGLRANGNFITGKDCGFYDFVEPGRDSQALILWNGARNQVWDNCLYQAASESMMIGGSDPASEAMLPQNLLFKRCEFSKDLVWNTWPDNGSIKALFEVKNVRGLQMDGCVFQGNWKDSWTTGVAIILKCANQENTAPYTTCEDVIITNSVIRNCGTVFTLVGWGDGWKPENPEAYKTQRMKNIQLRNILAYNLVTGPYTGEGRGMPTANTPDGLVVDHLTMVNNRHAFHHFWFHGGQARGSRLEWTNSVMWEASYGAMASAPYASDASPKPPAQTGIAALQQGGYKEVVFSGNVLAKSPERTMGWGPGNLRASAGDLNGCLDPITKEVIPGTLASTVVTTDGKKPGCDTAAILAATGLEQL